MKKTDLLDEARLSRLLYKGADAPLPHDLRQRTLARMGLAPVQPAWQTWTRPLLPISLAAAAAFYLLLPRPCPVVITQPTGQPAAGNPNPSAPAAARPGSRKAAPTVHEAPAPAPLQARKPAAAPAPAAMAVGDPKALPPAAGGHPLVRPPQAPAVSVATGAAPQTDTALSSAKAGNTPAVAPRGPVFRALPGILKAGQALVLDLSLETGGMASVRVFDAQGREVALVINALLPAGDHRLRWDASTAPSGAYTAVLTAPGRLDKARFLVVR